LDDVILERLEEDWLEVFNKLGQTGRMIGASVGLGIQLLLDGDGNVKERSS